MKRLALSLPLYSLIPGGCGVAALWVFGALLGTLRFLCCSTWIMLPPPPERATRLLGAPHNRLYLETSRQAVYCWRQDQWSSCLRPPYALQPDQAADWLLGWFEPLLRHGAVTQLIRSGDFSATAYYALAGDGQVWACSTNFLAEAEALFRSGAFVWLLLPLGVGGWSVVAFWQIVIRDGVPIWRDFWGRGERLK